MEHKIEEILHLNINKEKEKKNQKKNRHDYSVPQLSKIKMPNPRIYRM